MKRKLLLITTLFISSIAVNAQQAFHEQASGFTAVSRGISDFQAIDSNIVWAYAYDGSGGNATIRDFTMTNNGGFSWTTGAVKGTTPTALNTYGLANLSAIDADTAYAAIYPTAAGTLQGVYKTTNAGLNWTKVSTGTFIAATSFINIVHFFDANHGMAMGDPANGYFEIYTTSNAGATWVRVPQANIPADPLTGEYGTVGYYEGNSTTITFSTNFGRMLKSTDLGLNWVLGVTPLDSTADVSIPSISFKDSANGNAILNNSTLFKNTIMTTVDGGLNWLESGVDTANGVYDFNAIEYVKGTANTWFVTSANTTTGGAGASYTEDGGVNWINIDKVQHTCIRFNDINNGWSGGFNTSATVGGIFKWGSVRVAAGLNSNKVEGFSVYPNPSNGLFYVKANVNGASSIKVTDLTGRIIFAKDYPTLSLLLTSVDLSSANAGVYFIEVREGNKLSVQKVVVR